MAWQTVALAGRGGSEGAGAWAVSANSTSLLGCVLTFCYPPIAQMQCIKCWCSLFHRISLQIPYEKMDLATVEPHRVIAAEEHRRVFMALSHSCQIKRLINSSTDCSQIAFSETHVSKDIRAWHAADLSGEHPHTTASTLPSVSPLSIIGEPGNEPVVRAPYLQLVSTIKRFSVHPRPKA
jgi:hypothetical protein